MLDVQFGQAVTHGESRLSSTDDDGSRARHVAPLLSVDTDVDGHAVGEHVEHRRACERLFDDLAQLFLGRVALDVEAHADLLVTVPYLRGQTEDAPQIDVALDARLHRGEVHPSN